MKKRNTVVDKIEKAALNKWPNMNMKIVTEEEKKEFETFNQQFR